LKFLFYPNLSPGYRGTWPAVFARRKLSARKEAALVARCSSDAAAWAAAAGLPPLTGKPADIRAAEIYRAEYVRQKLQFARGFSYTKVSSASTWLMYMDQEIRED